MQQLDKVKQLIAHSTEMKQNEEALINEFKTEKEQLTNEYKQRMLEVRAIQADIAQVENPVRRVFLSYSFIFYLLPIRLKV